MRKQPFKTKMTPDFKIDWGKTYPKAVFTEREKVPVQTFDIKTFVKEQKKQKLLEMMNSTGLGNSSDDGGIPSFVPPNLFANNKRPEPNPFTMDMEAPTKLPINKALEPTKKEPPMPSFDVDELVKKIDAKIAELEKEEALAKEKEEKEKKEEATRKETSPIAEIVNPNPRSDINLNLDDSDNENEDDFFDDFFD